MSDGIKKPQSFQQCAAILLCSTFLVKIIGALFKIPLSSDLCLGDLGFGYFSSAYDLFTPIYSLAIAGFPVAVARVVAVQSAQGKYKDVRNTLNITKKLYLLTGFAAFILMIALIYPFVRLTDQTGKTVYSLYAIAPSIIFCCIMSTYRGYYEGLRNMYPTAVSNIIEALGKLILGFGFAYLTVKYTANVAYGAAAAMAGITAGTMLSALYLRLRHLIKGDTITKNELLSSPQPESWGHIAKTIIIIAIPVVLSSLASNIASLVDATTVKMQLTRLMSENSDVILKMYSLSISGYNGNVNSELTASQIPTFLYGIRGKAYTLYNLVPTFTTVLGVSALPVLASAYVTDDKCLIKRNIESMIKLTALISFPIGIGLAVLSTPIMSLIYSSTASAQIGGPLLRIFGLSALFSGIAIPLTCMLQAIGKQVAALRNIIFGTLIKIIVNFLAVGIPEINIKGAAYGTLACYIFIMISNLITLIRATKIFPDIFCVFLKPLISAAICGAAARIILLFGQTRILTAMSIIISGFVYLLFLIILKTFTESDILALPYGEKLRKICLKCRIIR